MDRDTSPGGSEIREGEVSAGLVASEHPRIPDSPFDDDIDAINPVYQPVSEDTQTTQLPVASDTGSSPAQAHDAKLPRHARPVKGTAVPLLRYRKTSICLLACYLPFLILPWILTCIMALRPPNLPSYYNQKGEYGSNMWLVMLFWMAFVRVLNAIASVLVVPITSALLAQGAVVYTQRRKVGQELNLRKTFALSDRGWTDIAILWGAKEGKSGSGAGSKYLGLAADLLLLSMY